MAAVTVVSIIIGVIFAVVIILFIVAIAMGEIVVAMLFSTIASFLALVFSVYVEIQNKRKRKRRIAGSEYSEKFAIKKDR